MKDKLENLKKASGIEISYEKLKDAISELTEKEKKIICLRFGLINGSGATLERAGKIFGMTRERIRQIEAKALEKIRQKFSEL